MVSSGGFLLESAIEFPCPWMVGQGINAIGQSEWESVPVKRKKGEQDSVSALMPRIRFDWYRISS